jgi:glucose-6-phosphate dehydrogenase assembly protein OpcA
VIVDLPDTTVSKIARSLVSVREEGGAVALGRVLTLVIVTTHGLHEEAIEAANDASREHPMRVIVLIANPRATPSSTRRSASAATPARARSSCCARTAAAASQEGLVTGLLLPDAPSSRGGRLPARPARGIRHRTHGPAPHHGCLDEALREGSPVALGAVVRPRRHRPRVDAPDALARAARRGARPAAVRAVTGVEVIGAGSSPSTGLLAAWLRLKLDVPVTWRYSPQDEWEHGIQKVRLTRANGDILLERTNDIDATLTQPGQPSHDIVLPAAPCANASRRSCAGSIRTSCMVE